MNIALDKDVEEFLQSQVRAGIFSAPDQFVNDLVRSIRDQQLSRIETTPELEEWLLQAAGEPVTPLTAEDFAAMRERARSALPRS